MGRPKRHHFVPRFYLKGFTKRSTEDDAIWVVDLAARRCWPSCPANAAIQKDFYRFELGSDIDPMWFEVALGKEAEPLMAEVLSFVLDIKDVPLCGFARVVFLNLVATSLVRGPSMRAAMSASFNEGLREQLRQLTQSEFGRAKLRKSLESMPLTLDQAIALNDNEAFRYDFDRVTHLKAMISQVDMALGAFSNRTWIVRQASDCAPDFICSDIPVGLIAIAESCPLLWRDPNAIVVMPLNRRIVALGMVNEIEFPDFLHVGHVARINTSITQGASFVYASEPQFTVVNSSEVQVVQLRPTGASASL